MNAVRPERAMTRLIVMSVLASLTVLTTTPHSVDARQDQKPADKAAVRDGDSEWDTTVARGTTREIDFTTSEGTWMSVDLSPDGQWVAFDLLGHIYRVRATGGEAECLTASSGVAINMHPRWSPDGRAIAFISDRKGQTNLWLMDPDGGNPRAVFLNRDIRSSEPAWSPTGGSSWCGARTHAREKAAPRPVSGCTRATVARAWS